MGRRSAEPANNKIAVSLIAAPMHPDQVVSTSTCTYYMARLNLPCILLALASVCVCVSVYHQKFVRSIASRVLEIS